MQSFVVMSRTGTTLPGQQIAIFVGHLSPTGITQEVWDLAEVYTYAFPQLHVHVWQSEDQRTWHVGNTNQPATCEMHSTLSGAVKKCREHALAALTERRESAESEYENLRALAESTQRHANDAGATLDTVRRLTSLLTRS